MAQTIKHPEQNEAALKLMGVSLAGILDTVRPRKDESYTARVRLTFNRESKYYTTKLNFTLNQWELMCLGKKVKEISEKKTKFYEIIKIANDTILSLNSFSFEKFEDAFLNKKSAWKDVFFAFDDYISSLKSTNQISTASIYLTSKNSLKSYHGRNTLLFEDVTIPFLTKYEFWMKSNKKSPTTISISVRCLRRLYNIAISKGDAHKENYPFGSESLNKYEPPQARNIKKALSITDIEKLFNYQTVIDKERYYLDIFLFSYLANGMNISDIARLKYENITGKEIAFIRKKVSSKRKTKPIVVYLNDELSKIIDRHGNFPKISSSYIFPILNDKLSAEAAIATIKQTTKQCNKYLSDIAVKLGIANTFTTYAARHSFASTLKFSGENIAFISESLGHTNIQTTENYLASFDTNKRIESQKKLLPWKK